MGLQKVTNGICYFTIFVGGTEMQKLTFTFACALLVACGGAANGVDAPQLEVQALDAQADSEADSGSMGGDAATTLPEASWPEAGTSPTTEAATPEAAPVGPPVCTIPPAQNPPVSQFACPTNGSPWALVRVWWWHGDADSGVVDGDCDTNSPLQGLPCALGETCAVVLQQTESSPWKRYDGTCQ